MRDPVLSARVPVDLALWVDEYALERGASRQEVIVEALRQFRELCQGGVPDLPAVE